MQKQATWQKYIKVVFTCTRYPHAQKPGYLEFCENYAYFWCCLIILQAYLKLEQQIVGDKKQSFAEK